MSVWHPLLAATEPEPGTWVMVDSTGQRYAVVRLIRRGGEPGYRAETWSARADDRELVGYYKSLRGATLAAHLAFISHHGVRGPLNGK